MKITKFFLMTVCVLGLVACSDDDDNNNDNNSVVANVVGTYNGTLETTVSGNVYGNSEFTVNLKKTSDVTVSVTIVNNEGATSNGGMSLGNIVIADVVVTDDGDSEYTLTKTISDEGYSVTDTASEKGTVWNFSEFEGYVSDGEIVLSMVAKPGAMPMSINMEFEGSK